MNYSLAKEHVLGWSLKGTKGEKGLCLSGKHRCSRVVSGVSGVWKLYFLKVIRKKKCLWDSCSMANRLFPQIISVAWFVHICLQIFLQTFTVGILQGRKVRPKLILCGNPPLNTEEFKFGRWLLWWFLSTWTHVYTQTHTRVHFAPLKWERMEHT